MLGSFATVVPVAPLSMVPSLQHNSDSNADYNGVELSMGLAKFHNAQCPISLGPNGLKAIGYDL